MGSTLNQGNVVITATANNGDFNVFSEPPHAYVAGGLFVDDGVYAATTNPLTTKVGNKFNPQETTTVDKITFYRGDPATFPCNGDNVLKIFSFGSGSNPEGALLASTTTRSAHTGALVDYCTFSINFTFVADLNYFIEVTLDSGGNSPLSDGYWDAWIDGLAYGGGAWGGHQQNLTYDMQLHLTNRAFRIECGSATGLSDLCTSTYAATPNPSCSWNGEIGDNNAFCRLRRTCDGCDSATTHEVSGTLTVDANTTVDVSISPTEPTVSDDLVPSVTLYFPDNDTIIGGTYTWQYRRTYSYAWTDYSSGDLVTCSGANMDGKVCTVPTISSDDTNEGNYWRIVIDANNNKNATISQGVYSVGIDVTTDLVTDIYNVTHETIYIPETGDYNVTFTPTVRSQDIIWKVFNTSFEDVDFHYLIKNNLQDYRQYFIYVADQNQYDSNSWVFSDYLTYGSSANHDDPVQKIWDGNVYDYNFFDFVLVGETKYYKLVYRYPMRYWDSITHDDWWHQLQPQNYDINGVSTDRYSVSTYSNVLSKIIPYLPNVDSNFTYAYELQFNAYADAAIDLTVGAWSDANNHAVNGATVSLTATEKRYSVDVEAGDVNNLVYMQTASTTANNVYLSNVVLIQRAYFKTRLRVIKANYEPLDVFITDVNGSSYRYIDEGVPFRFNTQIYDRDGKVRTQKVIAYAYGENDTNKVLVQDVNLVENYAVENTIDLSGLINGLYLIHDANVADGNDFYSRVPVLIKIQIADENGAVFEETGAWIQMHEYPYFYTDFFLQTTEYTRRLNTAPKGRIFAQARVPDNIEDIEMYIYQGNWFCPDWMEHLNAQCTAENTASDANVAFKYKFYKQDTCSDWSNPDAGCFTCDGENCSFNYDLEGQFHYAAETFHTTFSFMHFNTTDNNTYMSRTIYEIGKDTLDMFTEVQGLDQNAYAQCDGNATLFGLNFSLFTTYESMYAAIRDDAMVKKLVAAGRVNYNDIAEFTEEACGVTTGACQVTDFSQIKYFFINPISHFLSQAKCGATINQNTNIKIVAEIFTPQFEDIHQYESVWFQLTPCNDDNVTCEDANRFTNRLYPTLTYYDADRGSNIFVWNTILYDENGNYLIDQNYYRVDFYGEDGAFRFEDIDTSVSHDGNFRILIDNTFSAGEPTAVLFLPWVNMGSKDDSFYIDPLLSTSNKYLDGVEIIIYTDHSGNDPLKSDLENQRMKVNLDYEDILKLDQDANFDTLKEFYNFQAANLGQDMLQLCLVGAFVGPLGMFIADNVDLVKTGLGFGGMKGDMLGTFPDTFMKGCGFNSKVSYAYGDVTAMSFDENYTTIMDAFSHYEYRHFKMNFRNVHISDYAELLEEYELSEDDTSPETIISDLAELGETAHDEPLIIEVAGRTFELDNYLVDVSESPDGEVKLHDFKIKLIAHYNYYADSSFIVLDLGTFKTPESDILGQWENLVREWFEKYAILILAGILGLVVLVFAVRGLGARGG